MSAPTVGAPLAVGDDVTIGAHRVLRPRENVWVVAFGATPTERETDEILETLRGFTTGVASYGCVEFAGNDISLPPEVRKRVSATTKVMDTRALAFVNAGLGLRTVIRFVNAALGVLSGRPVKEGFFTDRASALAWLDEVRGGGRG